MVILFQETFSLVIDAWQDFHLNSSTEGRVSEAGTSHISDPPHTDSGARVSRDADAAILHTRLELIVWFADTISNERLNLPRFILPIIAPDCAVLCQVWALSAILFYARVSMFAYFLFTQHISVIKRLIISVV